MASTKAGTKAPKLQQMKLQKNEESKLACTKSMTPPKPKEIITVYDGDGERSLIVPSRDPIDIPGIWSKSEFTRLKNQAHIVTLQDRMAMLQEAESKKNSLQMASEKRKEEMKKAQRRQEAKLGTRLSDVERDAKKKNLYLLQRSHELMQEQDNRVKAANGIILATKCRAIREAQIAEKELIAKQLQDEEKRLDMMMEQHRQAAMEEEKRKQEEDEQKRGRFTKDLLQQMKLNETERLIEAERIEEESRIIQKAFLAVQREELERLKQKKIEQETCRNQLKQSNVELEKFKERQREEERIADLRIRKFMEAKQKREEEREKEQALAKAAKEQEIARLRAQQQKSQDRQALLDEMNALRIKEEVEREWRRKEMEAAKKRKEQDEILRIEREKQIEDLRKLTAIRLAKDEEEFHKVAKVQRELYEKEKEKEKRMKEEAEKYRKDLLKQINEKERSRITQQKEKYEEGKLYKQEEVVKDQHIKEHIKKKVDKLRQAKIPEHYVRDVENQLQNIKTLEML